MFLTVTYSRFVFLFLGIFISTVSYGQYINNPSFELKSGESGAIPSGWYVCKPNSTPDIQPGRFAVNKMAQEGENYISLVTRGFLGPNAATTEEVVTQLNKPLVKDSCYTFDIDLALSDQFGHEINDGSGTTWLSYANPVRIKIWGGTGMCDKTELLWTSDLISNTEWENYSTIIRPELNTLLYLFIEADYEAGATQYFGNVAVDNIQLTTYEPEEMSTEVIGEIGENIQLTASEGTNYEWSPNAHLNCENCPDPSFTLKESCTYEVVYTDEYGCVNKEHFNIWLRLIVPNIITPNGDGYNDVFSIQGLRPNAELTIYNRWGVPVFYSVNYAGTWDGLDMDLEIVKDGVYFYYLVNGSAENTTAGSLQVVR